MLIPKILTLIITLAGLSTVVVLGMAAWSHRNPPAETAGLSLDSPKEFGPKATNRWLRELGLLFVLLIAAVVAMHAYWVFWSDSNSRFVQAKTLDARNRRLAESGLKGWVFDRAGRLETALIRYRADAGVITREYPLGPAAVHLTGYSDFVFGSGGIEYACRTWLTEPASAFNQMVSPVPVGKDLRLSVDGPFQRDLFNLLQNTGKPAAAVVLLLPNNEVLAMASTPSFDPMAITNESRWLEMSEQAEKTPELSPLVNRALGTLLTGGPAYYYRPGSTFKTFVAAVAIDAGLTREKFTCRPDGFTPPGVTRPIKDFEGEVHGTIGFEDAFKFSCNQYFAQLGLKLGKERLSSYARRLGFETSPDDDRSRARDMWQIGHGSEKDFNSIFAPPVSRMNLSSSATSYDIALQSFGQGFDDVTVMQMALIAACAASADGMLVAPTFELGLKRKVAGPFISRQSAAKLRSMMRSVVQSGTAAGAFAGLAGRIAAGGKTGTADRDVMVYDRDGKPVVDYLDREGRPHYKFRSWTDSWFIGFAPADDPRVAFAIVVENGGQGARAAAPVAVKLIERAAALGYLRGEKKD